MKTQAKLFLAGLAVTILILFAIILVFLSPIVGLPLAIAAIIGIIATFIYVPRNFGLIPALVVTAAITCLLAAYAVIIA